MDLQQKKSGRNIYLDLFRVILAAMIIYIHYGSGGGVGICRVAVPMFFAISGYFLYNSDNDREKKNAKKFIINSLKYLFVGISIYILYDFIVVLINNGNIFEFFKSLYINDFILNVIFLNNTVTTGFHLWFLVALVIVSCIHYFLCYFDKTNYYYIIIPVCLIVALFFGGYIEMIQPNSVEEIYVRNAIFTGLPMVGIGYSLNKLTFLYKKSYYKWIYLFLGIAMLLLQAVEYMIFPMEIYISSILSSIFLLLFFVQLKSSSTSKISNFYYKYIGKNMPFYIYVLHVAVARILSKINCNEYLYLFLIFITSFAVYEVFHLLRLLINKLFIKYNISKC